MDKFIEIWFRAAGMATTTIMICIVARCIAEYIVATIERKMRDKRGKR